MGFFNKLRTAAASPAPNEAAARAILGVTLISGIADGGLDEREYDQLVSLCAFNALFQDLGQQKCRALLVEIADTLKRQGPKAVLAQAAAVLTPRQAETAMCFAARVALSDGRLQDGEIAALLVMGQSLGVSEETFKQIVSVMIMLQRRS